MPRLRRYQAVLSALLLAPSLAYQAAASEDLVGEYTGRLTSVVWYPGTVGEPCDLTIGESDMYGGSLVFQIANISGSILMEKRNVEKALAENAQLAKVTTPGIAGKPAEGIVIVRGESGALKNLKMMLKGGMRGPDKSIACGQLVKK